MSRWTRISVLISSYGTPLAERASYLALHSSLYGPDGAVNYDYIITNSINSLLIGFPIAHTLTIFEPICPIPQNVSKTLTWIIFTHSTSTCTCTSTCTHSTSTSTSTLLTISLTWLLLLSSEDMSSLIGTSLEFEFTMVLTVRSSYKKYM